MSLQKDEMFFERFSFNKIAVTLPRTSCYH